MIVVALALLLGTALAVAWTLALDSFAAFWLAVYLVFIAEAVAVIEALSLFRGVTSRNVLLAQLAVFALAAAVMIRRRRRLVWPRFPRVPLRRLTVDEPLLAVMLVVVGTAIVYELALAVLTPPNNWDSMSYHLSRAAAWYQHHGVAYVDAHTERENAYQPNSEILVLYTFLFAHRDTFAAAWQWLAEVPSLVAIYMVARRLDFDRPQAVFGALLFAALSQTALQAVTTQNDLLAASLVASCVAFLASRERHRLWLAAVALGLALGTKLTVVFALPAVAILAALLVPRREWKQLAGLIVLATAVFGSFGYVLNVANSGSLLGPQSATAVYQQHSWIGRLGTIAGVSLRVVLDPPFPNEDFSYFGPLGAVVVIPVVVLSLRRWRQGRATALEAALACALPLYIVGLAFLYRLNPWIGRFMLTPAALVAPLFASVYRNRHYAAAASAIATVGLGLTLLFNHAKPSGIGAGRSIWTMTRTEAQTVQRFRMGPVFTTVAACVPEHVRVGYVLGGDDWDYPLFGEHLTRTIVRLHRPTPLRRADDLHLEWLLIRRSLIGQIPSHWSTMRFRGTEIVLLQRRPSPSRVARHATLQCDAARHASSSS
jgi:hypothetical protein